MATLNNLKINPLQILLHNLIHNHDKPYSTVKRLLHCYFSYAHVVLSQFLLFYLLLPHNLVSSGYTLVKLNEIDILFGFH